MANWTPDGMLGKLFSILARYSPAGTQVDLPVSWGDESVLQERLGPYAKHLEINRRLVRFRSPSPTHWVDFMKANFGPAIVAFRHTAPEDHQTLEREMRDLLQEYNRSPNGTVLSESEYIEVVATRR
jgi:hypothetical protein